jgi:hypothetical protein
MAAGPEGKRGSCQTGLGKVWRVEKNDLSIAIWTIGEELAVGNQSSPIFEVVVEGSPRNLRHDWQS